MSVWTSHRVSAGMAPLVAAGLLLGACGSAGDDAASRPTIKLEVGETAYATLPVATIPEADAGAEANDVAAGGVQDYTVQIGDYGLKVASDFGVSLGDLENINGWSDAGLEFPNPGSVIKIPAGGTAQAADSTDADTAAEGDTATPAESTDGADAGETGEAIPEVGDNCEAGSHTVAAGDIPLKLVDLYDVTLDALEQANANNPAYGTFIPGEQIVIPERDNC